MYRKIIVIGASGMLGKAFMSTCRKKEVELFGLSRKGSEIKCDIEYEYLKLKNTIESIKPDLVINCAALVSLNECELNPMKAKRINANSVNYIVDILSSINCRFIHISTDHYYTGDNKKLHNEEDIVKLLNVYAYTKYEGERNALKYKNSLIIRTNVTGFRYQLKKPTFIEWLSNSIINKQPIHLYTDFYTSTIDSKTLAKYCIEAVKSNFNGLLNIASSNCVSKKEFAHILAKKLNVNLDWANDSSVKQLIPRRCESLGLDCSKAENILNIKMPSTDEVVDNLVKEM